jgi:hypothetical protein
MANANEPSSLPRILATGQGGIPIAFSKLNGVDRVFFVESNAGREVTDSMTVSVRRKRGPSRGVRRRDV